MHSSSYLISKLLFVVVVCLGVLLSLLTSSSLLCNAQSINRVINLRIIAREYDRVALNCTNEAPPETQQVLYSWERPTKQVIGREYQYIVNRMTSADVGLYQCFTTFITSGNLPELVRVDIDLQLESSNRGEILIVFEPQIDSNRQKRLYFGQTYYQVCRVQGEELSRFTYRWITPTTIKSDIQVNGNSWFVTKVDREHGGEYICIAKDINSGKEYRASMSIVVTGTPVGPIEYEAIVNVLLKPFLGQKFRMICSTRPQVQPVQYQWFVNDQFTAVGEEFLIENLKKEDYEKNYKCIASNDGRNRSAVYYSAIDFTRDTEIRLMPPPGSQVMVHAGERKELHCEIDSGIINGVLSIFGRDVKWFFNGLPFNNNANSLLNAERIDRVRVSMIVLRDIGLQNEGLFECRTDTFIKQIYVAVISQTASIAVVPQEETVLEGSVVEFHCRIFNDPSITNQNLQWYFLGLSPTGVRKSLSSSWNRSDPSSTIETSFIAAEKVVLSDEGYYLCVDPNGRQNMTRLIITALGGGGSVNVTVTPREIKITPNEVITIQCEAKRLNEYYGVPLWKFAHNNLPISTDVRFQVVSSSIGKSTLLAVGLDASAMDIKVICYLDNEQDEATIRVTTPCHSNSVRCRNGQCIERSQRCNNFRDCADGSDEDPDICRVCDPLNFKCEVHNGNPPKSLSISSTWLCDGEDDCGNGFDELNCKMDQQQTCGGNSFRCNDGKDIPKSFVCDSEPDCNDREDELSCTPIPIINNHPRTQYTYRSDIGSTVVLTCNATANPLPSVVWRHNWRCLRDNIRMKVTSSSENCFQVVSQLTITNIEPGDDGIYNCEAVSLNNRAMSDDYQVYLQQRV